MGVRDGERGHWVDPFGSDEEEIRLHKGARDWHLDHLPIISPTDSVADDDEDALLTLRSPAVFVDGDEDLLERRSKRPPVNRDARLTRSAP